MYYLTTRHDQQRRRGDKFNNKTFENLNLCPIDATNEYLKRRSEYHVAHTKFLFTKVCTYGPLHKHTVARWVKNTLTQAAVNTVFFSRHSFRLSGSSKTENVGVDFYNILKMGCWSQQFTFSMFYSKELEYMDNYYRVAETIVNSFKD